jgi:hypothetical protein
LSGGK